MEDEDEIHFEVEDDFKEKIFQIYLIHFLVEDFLDEGKEDEDKLRDEVKILNMIFM
jgi:hypothetical protein